LTPAAFSFAGGGWRLFQESLRDEVLAQVGSAFLRLVVVFASGIGVFFAWPTDPWPWLGPLLSSLAVGGLLLRRRMDGVAMGVLGLLAFGLGLTAAQVRTRTMDAPALAYEIGPLEVVGRVYDVEREPGRIRVILERVQFDADDVTQKPVRVRLSVPAKHGAPRVGDVIAVKAVLRPPERPVVPGGFEYQRFLFFDRIGALGYTLQAWQLRESKPEGGFRQGIENLRRNIADRILAVVPGDAGAVAVALVTGEQSLITEPMQEAYRVSGLAHLLSISGLHMTMLAAAVFVLVRRSLALWPYAALRLDLKKVAAFAALAATSFYVLISGLSVPAIRAFIMVAVVILAIFVDRRAVSLRSVGLAALALLAIYPEALVGPSFQMSFMAVIALVAMYERFRLRPQWRGPDGELLLGKAILVYVAALMVTDLAAGSVTSIFAAYHFNRMPSYSMVANMIATPLTGVWVMPTALLALALMPVGLDGPVWWLMGEGVAAINNLAAWVATWPGAQVHVPPMATWAIALAAFGLLLLCLWQGRLRWLGVVPVIAAMCQPWLSTPPDLIVDESGRVLALIDGAGRVVMKPDRRDKFVRSVLISRYGQSSETWPSLGAASISLGVRCDAQGCAIERHGRTVSFAFSTDAVAEDCGTAQLLIAPNQFVDDCVGSQVIDRGHLFREGAQAIYLAGDDIRIETVEGVTGERAWSRQPQARRRAMKSKTLPPDTSRSEDLGAEN